MNTLPPFQIFPELSNQNINLRAIRNTDVKDIIEISFYDGKQAEHEAEALTMQAKINKDYCDGNTIHWGIFEQKSGIILGTCGYYRGFKDGIGELGCVLKPAFRGKGYMTSALGLALSFGKEVMQLNQITAITSVENLPAQRLLTRLQFQIIGYPDAESLEYTFMPQQ